MLFLDLEIYVPVDDRNAVRASMVADPTRETHKLLGGCFVSKCFDDAVPGNPVMTHLWIWNFASELELVAAIVELFELEWEKQQKENAWILGKPATDLVVCGLGIAKFDMPALFYRAQALGVGSPSAMYELFLKARSIDLAHTSSFLFPEEPVLYPKTAKEVAGRLRVGPKKGPSTNVWDMYDRRDYDRIAQRTEGEVRTVLDIYRQLQNRIRALPRPS